MSTYFNIYENIDAIDPAELKRAGGIKDPEKVTWPKGKKYKVQLSGKECSVTTYFSKAEGSLYGSLDAYTALSTMMSREEVVNRIHTEDPNGHTDADIYAHAEFLPGLPKLTDEEREHRRAVTAAILTLLSDQKTIEVLAECAPRKKNGLFHKGRIFKIGLTGLAEPYNSELIEIIGKSKDETSLSVTVTSRTTSPDELSDWNKDFISTYHPGLPISEALKTVLNIDTSDEIVSNEPQNESLDKKQGNENETVKTEKQSASGKKDKKDYLNFGGGDVTQYVICPDQIDCTGKTFVFDRYVTIYHIYDKWLSYKEFHELCINDQDAYYKAYALDNTDPRHPLIKAVLDAGGAVRREISGKTDYYVKDFDAYSFSETEKKKILEQKAKGKPLMIVPLSHFKQLFPTE